MNWFNELHIIGKCAVALLSLPILFLLVGFVIFMHEPPDNSFWGTDKPTWRHYLGGTMVIGFIATAIIVCIFGTFYLPYCLLNMVGIDSAWVFSAVFIACVVGVLRGIYHYIEGRHYTGLKENADAKE